MTGISSLLFTEMPEDPEDAHAWDCSATSGDEYCMSAKQGRMCSRAANNQSLGGVGEKKQNEGGGWGGVVKLFLSRFHEHSCHPPECL